MTKSTSKRMKYQEENTKNYQNPKTQQSIEKLIPTSDMIILKTKKEANKHTKKLEMIIKYVVNMDINLTKYVQFI